MKHAGLIVAIILCFSMLGCGNLSPRQRQEIDNKGQIGEIENLANSLKAEVGKLQNQNDIQDSQIGQMLQGIGNSQNSNSGVQILSGPGGLLLSATCLMIVAMIALHYRKQAVLHEKTANILAEKIVETDDPNLEDKVFQAVMHTDVAKTALTLIKKHQTNFRAMK